MQQSLAAAGLGAPSAIEDAFGLATTLEIPDDHDHDALSAS
jgi:2-polyprenyl-6-methoxyphenol hydroxylase-like FAD-dependent oxidoreductase